MSENEQKRYHDDLKDVEEFLTRCENENTKSFFSKFLNCQKTRFGRTRITWDHQCGFSMQFYFKGQNEPVPMVWGFPTFNKKGQGKSGKEGLQFPFDCALNHNVPKDYLDSIRQALSEGAPLSVAPMRPSINVSDLTPLEIEHIFKTVSEYVDKAQTVTL